MFKLLEPYGYEECTGRTFFGAEGELEFVDNGGESGEEGRTAVFVSMTNKDVATVLGEDGEVGGEVVELWVFWGQVR